MGRKRKEKNHPRDNRIPQNSSSTKKEDVLVPRPKEEKTREL